MSGCGCSSYGPGHNCHVIQVKLANGDPTSWFPGTVVKVGPDVEGEGISNAVVPGGQITVEYDDHDRCRLWRHGGFDHRFVVGTPVVVAEHWSVLVLPNSGSGGAQLSVRSLTDESGKRDLPEDRPRFEGAGITNLETGEGIDLHR